MRKIIQISAVESTPHNQGAETTIFALCDDGTLFFGRWKNFEFSWSPLPNIPQGKGRT